VEELEEEVLAAALAEVEEGSALAVVVPVEVDLVQVEDLVVAAPVALAEDLVPEGDLVEEVSDQEVVDRVLVVALAVVEEVSDQ
jgi:hypothetical protein